TLPLVDTNSKPFKFLPRLRRLRVGQCGDWQAWIAADAQGAPIAGRVCAIKKSKAAAQRAREQAQHDSAHGGHRIRPETLEAAAYILVFTTIADVPASAILEFYRGRWQVEIAFKRLKSLLALGHLKKSDVDGAKAWLQGKLLVAILIET